MGYKGFRTNNHNAGGILKTWDNKNNKGGKIIACKIKFLINAGQFLNKNPSKNKSKMG